MWETKKFSENKFSLINSQFGNMFHSAREKKKEAKNAVPVSCHQGLDRHPLLATQTPPCNTHTHNLSPNTSLMCIQTFFRGFNNSLTWALPYMKMVHYNDVNVIFMFS